MPPLLLLEDAAGAAADEGALHAEVLEDEAAAAADDQVVDCKCQVLPALYLSLYISPWKVAPMPERQERG